MCGFNAAAGHRPLARSREQAISGCRSNGCRGARKSSQLGNELPRRLEPNSRPADRQYNHCQAGPKLSSPTCSSKYEGPVPRSSMLTSLRPAPSARRTCSVVLMATIRDLGLLPVNDCRARLADTRWLEASAAVAKEALWPRWTAAAMTTP